MSGWLGVIAVAARLLPAALACPCFDALRYWQLLRAYPALLLAMAVLASGGSTLMHLSVLQSCAVPDDGTIAAQLAPSAVTGRWQCWKRGQLARCHWPAGSLKLAHVPARINGHTTCLWLRSVA